MSTSDPSKLRLDILLGLTGVFVLLLACAAFLMAAKEMREAMEISRKGFEERLGEKEPPPTIHVKCDPLKLDIPAIYVDYSLQRKMIDEGTLQIDETVYENEVEESMGQYDPIYPVDSHVLHSMGMDNVKEPFKFHAHPLPESMRASSGPFFELGGPAPSLVNRDIAEAPVLHELDEREEGDDMSFVGNLSKTAGKGLMEIRGKLEGREDVLPVSE